MIYEINWMVMKYSVEFIRCDNKVSCDCSHRNDILGSSLEAQQKHDPVN